MNNIYKKNKLAFLITFMSLIFILTACGKNGVNDIAGTYQGNAGSVLILNKDKTGKINGGDFDRKLEWEIKDGYVFMDRDYTNGVIKFKIPDGKIENITVEGDEDSKYDANWRTELFQKTE